MANYTKNIFINGTFSLKIPKNIFANVLIPGATNLVHEQYLVSTNWAIVENQDSLDFAISEEVEEIIPPESTTFDYSQEYNEDSQDFALNDESQEVIAAQTTSFDYSQENNGDPTDTAITEPMES
jgi:hypothetical protein